MVCRQCRNTNSKIGLAVVVSFLFCSLTYLFVNQRRNLCLYLEDRLHPKDNGVNSMKGCMDRHLLTSTNKTSLALGSPDKTPTKVSMKGKASVRGVEIHRKRKTTFKKQSLENLKRTSYNESSFNDTFCGPNNNYCKEKVLILTPIKNSYRHLNNYVNLITSLNYPHSLISVVLGEDSSTDGTYEKATNLMRTSFTDFRNAVVLPISNSVPIKISLESWAEIHKKENQFLRRQHLAKSRNGLLMSTLEDQDWVLWIDSDVRWFPANIIQGLIYAKKQIVVPSCLYRKKDGTTDVYDRNTWRETTQSVRYQQSLPKESLVLEGYDKRNRRLFLPQLKPEGEVVPIDGVGGCVLLVRADLHRSGLVFPPFVFEHHIETEGLAKMAAAMGVKPHGMPWVEVFHL